jgi:hypothetical protein
VHVEKVRLHTLIQPEPSFGIEHSVVVRARFKQPAYPTSIPELLAIKHNQQVNTRNPILYVQSEFGGCVHAQQMLKVNA